MAEKRCHGCMQPMEGPVCASCGWQEGKRNEPHQLQPGMLLRDQYEIGRVLGQGGFGITYLGWDHRLEAPVCIKEYFPSHAVSRDCTVSTVVHCHTEQAAQSYHASKERFLREAKVLAQFRDIPEIVGVYNFFEENNTAYIVMEYIRGTDLAHYIQRRGGVLSAEETFRILRPVMQAMAAVHRGELVHRDIAPDNIMLHPRGGAKLLDFGAARMVENADVERGLNRSTEAIVKHGFAPMEQYQSRGNLGPWTDVYAMCATVYYCLTGQIPPEATSRMMGEAVLDWNQVPGLTAQQRYALDKGMAIHARDRYASMEELMEGLFSQHQPVQMPRQPIQVPHPQYIPNAPAAPQPRKKKKGLLIGIVAAVLVLAVAAGGWLLGSVLLNNGISESKTPAMEAPQAEAPRAEAPQAEPVERQTYSVLLVSGVGMDYYGGPLYEFLSSYPDTDVQLEYVTLPNVDGQVELIMEQWSSGKTADVIIWAPGAAVPEDRLRLVQETADVSEIPVILVGWDPSYPAGSNSVLENSRMLCFAGADPRMTGRAMVRGLESIGWQNVDINGDDRISYLFIGDQMARTDSDTCAEMVSEQLEEYGMMSNLLEKVEINPQENASYDYVMDAYGRFGNQVEVIFCMDEEIAWAAITTMEAYGVAMGKDVFIVTVGDDGLQDMVATGNLAVGVVAGYDTQFSLIRRAIYESVSAGKQTHYYRVSYETVMNAAVSASVPETSREGTWAVVTASELNIRSAPAMSADSVGTYYKDQQVQILSTQDVNGIRWGLTDKGWINLDYVRILE